MPKCQNSHSFMCQLDTSRGIFGNLISSTRHGDAWSAFLVRALVREEFIMAVIPSQALLSNIHLPHGLVGICHGLVGDLHTYLGPFWDCLILRTLRHIYIAQVVGDPNPPAWRPKTPRKAFSLGKPWKKLGTGAPKMVTSGAGED